MKSLVSLEFPMLLATALADNSRSVLWLAQRVALVALVALVTMAAAVPCNGQSGQIIGLGNKCVDVFQSGTSVVLWECTGNTNQEWQLVESAGMVEIRGLGDQCLQPGVVGASGLPELEIGACYNQASKWNVGGSLGGVFELINAESGLCLDVLGSETANGTPLIAFQCRGQANQEWRLTKDRSTPAYLVPFFKLLSPMYLPPVTTLLAVRNPASHPVEVRYQYFPESRDYPRPSVTEFSNIAPHGVKTANVAPLRLEGTGWIGITAVDAPTGKPLAVQDLYGDYFQIDPANNFATGDRLLATDSSLCNSWHVRFLSGGDFDGGTTFRFLVPEFEGVAWSVKARVFDEQGVEGPSFVAESTLHGLQIPVDSLNLSQSFGAIEWTFENGELGHLSAVMDAFARFSVGFEAECRD